MLLATSLAAFRAASIVAFVVEIDLDGEIEFCETIESSILCLLAGK